MKAIALTMALMLLVSPLLLQEAFASNHHKLTVNAYTHSGTNTLNMYVTIYDRWGNTAYTGFTPAEFTVRNGAPYTVVVADFQNLQFRNWADGSGDRERTWSGTASNTFNAYYTGSVSSSSSSSDRTGLYVALYANPTTRWSEWQKVINVANKYPDVPILVTINPNSGPGDRINQDYVRGINQLKNAGVQVIGYIPDGWADTRADRDRSMSYMKGAIDKYSNWYSLDGVFLDEMSNKAGTENRYNEIKRYSTTKGMTIVMGNPGTSVPSSLVNTIDIINIYENKARPDLDRIQVLERHDKSKFSYMWYNASWLDTEFIRNSTDKVGYIYITSGNDNNSRWFVLPNWMDRMAEALTR